MGDAGAILPSVNPVNLACVVGDELNDWPSFAFVWLAEIASEIYLLPARQPLWWRYCFSSASVHACACVSVCLSVCTKTKKTTEQKLT